MLQVFLPVDLNWMASRVTRRPSFKLTLDLTLRKYKSGQLTIFFTRIGTKAKQLLEDFLVESTLLGNEALGTVSWEKERCVFGQKKESISSKLTFKSWISTLEKSCKSCPNWGEGVFLTKPSLSVSKSYIWIGRRKSQANIPVRVIRIIVPMPYKIEL